MSRIFTRSLFPHTRHLRIDVASMLSPASQKFMIQISNGSEDQTASRQTPSMSLPKELLESPEFVMIPFSGTPGPHQIAEAIGVQPGAILGAHGAAARTADGERLYLNRRRQSFERARIALHFPPHQVIAQCRHIVAS